MRNLRRFHFWVVSILILFAAFVLSGCPNKETKPIVEDQDQVQNPPPGPQPSLQSSALEGTDLGEWALKGAVSPIKVTEEEIRNLTAYGAVFYPNSTLNPEKSIHQKPDESVDIYNLLFDSSDNLTAVVKWFSDNLGGGCTQTSGALADGSSFVGFNCASGDGGWNKRITIKGYPSGTVTEISVYITRFEKPSEGGGAGTG